MPVIDAHHHFLDPGRIAYPFLRFLPELDRFTGAEALGPLVRDAGVDYTVAVQAADHEDETRFLLDQAAEAPWVAGVVGWVPLLRPEAAGRALEGFAGGRFCGVRHLIHDEADDDWVVQEPVLESLALLAGRKLSFDLSAFNSRHISHVTTFAERVPGLDVILCHMGFPRLDQQEWEPWASSFEQAARNPRCVVKISGLDMTVGGCDAERFRPYLDHALVHFGPERMIWASNWPVSLQGHGYPELLETARSLLSALEPGQRDAVFGGTAARVYRLRF